jgi:hypothetical protein
VFLKPDRGATFDEDREKGADRRRTELRLHVVDGLVDDAPRLIGEPLL